MISYFFITLSSTQGKYYIFHIFHHTKFNSGQILYDFIIFHHTKFNSGIKIKFDTFLEYSRNTKFNLVELSLTQLNYV